MNDLNDRLANAPREALAGDELWPDIARRLGRGRRTGIMRAAAALAIFAAGGITGMVYERLNVRAEQEALPSSPFEAALAVQHAGSQYLTAVSRLRRLAPANSLTRDQGYESAMTVLVVAAQEVAAGAELDDARLIAEARRAHRATIVNTALNVQRGGR